MKKLLFGLLVLVDLKAFAGIKGLPSQDPVVSMLRKKFELSVQPSIKELHFGKSWNCKEFYAFKDSFKVLEGERSF